MKIAPFSAVDSRHIVDVARRFGTPCYLYDESLIIERCRSLLNMPSAFGLQVHYAMKANSNRAILQIIHRQGIGMDASSVNEAERAHRAGVPFNEIMLTTQDVPLGQDRVVLEEMLLAGMTYNICSLRQLELILPFVAQHKVKLAIRVSPGVGAGESVTRNTGDKYSSFGVQLNQLITFKQALAAAGTSITHVHAHIGSGGDPEIWRKNIDRMLTIVEEHFPEAETVNLGGGFKEARMPDEVAANVPELGNEVVRSFSAFQRRTGRALKVAIEPGTYVVANAGFLIARVLDLKSSGPDGFEFAVLNAGMESCTRPLLYGSRHPFYVVDAEGHLLSSDFGPSSGTRPLREMVIVGRCCESGDSQTLDDHGHVTPRSIAVPQPDDLLVIGGAGAYCSAMSLVNYNSYLQAPEVLLRSSGAFQPVRRRQSLEQVLVNELPLDEG